ANGELGATAFNGDSRWLDITVNGTPLSPRQPMTATPYALQTRGIFVAANGHVGIGTSNPPNMLTIVGGGLSVSDDLDEDVVFTTNRFMVSNRSNEDPAYVYTYSPEQHDFFVGGTSCLTIAPSGNVGIGTSAPAARLHVQSTAFTGMFASGPSRGVQ